MTYNEQVGTSYSIPAAIYKPSCGVFFKTDPPYDSTSQDLGIVQSRHFRIDGANALKVHGIILNFTQELFRKDDISQLNRLLGNP